MLAWVSVLVWGSAFAAQNPPREVYADASYPTGAGAVGFPKGAAGPKHWLGLDAFNSIQAAIDQVAEDGVVYVAAGTYIENVVVRKPLFVLGPNVGIAGESPYRNREARIIPQSSDPENTAIISVESDGVVIDGMLLDGNNPALAGGYNANGVRVHAAAGVQNGRYPDLVDVERITVRNNIITNISYDGICLDRYQYFGTSSAWNYIRHNKLANMWEGILTYAVDSIIANNLITNVTHGIGVHCVTTPAPKGFSPLVMSNSLTIAQWWPVEIQAARAPGIWINFRQEDASPIEVRGNVLNFPKERPALKTEIGLYALTVEKDRKVDFIDNSVNGMGNCTVGLLAANCARGSLVTIQRGVFNDIQGTGVLADTLDAKWGNGDCSIACRDVAIRMKPGGSGVLALQESATPTNSAFAEITGNCRIHGGAYGIEARGTNVSLSIVGKQQLISGNDIGIGLAGGRALIEGNLLVSNRVAAIQIDGGAFVDAGDCSGQNVSRLGTGTGINGSSAGLNDFSGYRCDYAAPWAITNGGSVPVVADLNFFEAQPGEDVRGAFCGPVRFSDDGILDVQPPPPVQVECIGQVPAAAQSLAEFVAAGGAVTAGLPTSIRCRDTIVTNRAGHYTVTRTYTFTGGCNQVRSCMQNITAQDNQGPTLLCSGGIVQAVDPGCDYATVTFTNVAADSCGELLGSWVPVSTGRFPIGTNTIIVVATDYANNSSACSFDIAVIGRPVVGAQLRILGVARSVVTLELTAQPARFAILTSTNFTDWVGLQTNTAPFILRHTNSPMLPYRFYRAMPVP